MGQTIRIGDFIGSKLSPFTCGFVTAIGTATTMKIPAFRVRLANGTETLIVKDDAQFVAPREWDTPDTAVEHVVPTMQEVAATREQPIDAHQLARDVWNDWSLNGYEIPWWVIAEAEIIAGGN